PQGDPGEPGPPGGSVITTFTDFSNLDKLNASAAFVAGGTPVSTLSILPNNSRTTFYARAAPVSTARAVTAIRVRAAGDLPVGTTLAIDVVNLDGSLGAALAA